MSCLDATFTLTPQSPRYSDAIDNYASIDCYGADFWNFSPEDFSSLYANDLFFFDANYVSAPNVDYTQWTNLTKARYLQLYIYLPSYAAAHKQLALIFGFRRHVHLAAWACARLHQRRITPRPATPLWRQSVAP